MKFNDVDANIRLNSQRRECDGQVVFHAGRALELAMQIVYARGKDRIMGREYPDVPRQHIIDDTQRGHNLAQLYERILRELDNRNMKHAFDDIYLQSLHTGVVDLLLDGNVVASFLLSEDAPFSETKIGGISDGAELTMDHTSFPDLILPFEEASKFSEMPYRTFDEFLTKADAAYYESDIRVDEHGNPRRRNMRWSAYSARDHESGRPYVKVGVHFFARLTKGIVMLSRQPWTWDKKFYERWFTRRRHNIMELMNSLAKQNLDGDVSFPSFISNEKAANLYGSNIAQRNLQSGYDHLHQKWCYETRTENSKG